MNRIIRPRLWVVGGGIFFVYLMLFLQIVAVTVFDSTNNHTRINTAPVFKLRADIYDAKGVLIANMLSTNGVRVSPRMVDNPQKLAKDLAAIFPDISYADMYDKVTKKSSLVLLQKYIDQNQHNALVALGDTYGKNAVVTETRNHLYVRGKNVTDTAEIAHAIARVFPHIPYDTIHRKIRTGADNILISEQVSTSDQQALQVVAQLYGDNLFRISEKKVAFVRPRWVTDAKGLTDALSRIFPQIPYDNLYKRVARKSDFVWVKRRTTPEQAYNANALGEVSVKLEQSHMRVYPQQQLFSHVLGYVDVDNKGISGIEKAKNTLLSTQQQPLYLTLDTGVQHIVRSEMLKVIDATDAIGGVAIVMNVKNGEVVSMVSLPDFNPNALQQQGDKFNRATVGVYELGSTFKIINSALALDSGKVKISDSFDARRPLKVDRFTIHDYHAKNRILDVSEIFIYSSNIGSALMAQKVGTTVQRQMMEKLQFLNRLPIVLPEKSSPLYPKRWHQTETMTIAYGHGISITPLHLTSAVASLINGGIYRTPKFIKSGTQNENAGHRVVSQQTSEMIRKLMRLNTLEGSGKKSAVKGFVLGGKTGTADKVKQTGGYDEQALIASYIAGFPMHDPKYVVYVMVDSPQAGAFTNNRRPTGGQVAAPTVARIVNRIAPLLGVIPVDENSPQVQNLKIPSYEKQKARRKNTL